MMLYRPARTPAAGFGVEIFFNREIYAPVWRSMNVARSRRGVPLKKRNIVGILLNFRGPAGSALAAIHYLRFFIFQFSFFNSSSSLSPSLLQALSLFHHPTSNPSTDSGQASNIQYPTSRPNSSPLQRSCNRACISQKYSILCCPKRSLREFLNFN